jgi:hypothetical protein
LEAFVPSDDAWVVAADLAYPQKVEVEQALAAETFVEVEHLV